MLTLTGLALPAVTSLFASIIPVIFTSLGSLLVFAIPRAGQLPRYIKALLILYQDSTPESQTRKYVTGALLILGGILTFMAHSFIPFTGVPIIGAVTTPVALLIALVVILTTLDLITQLNEPYLANLKAIHVDDLQNMQDDLLTMKVQLGKNSAELSKKVQKILDDLSPKIAECGKDVSNEINKYFSKQLHELVLYVDPKIFAKISLNDAEIKIISESLEPWKKVGGSFLLGAGAGAGTGMLASTVAAANLAPAAWWTPFVPGALHTLFFGGKTVVSATTFSLCTVAAPIALGLTIGTGAFSAIMFGLGKIEEKKLSQFLSDIIIASLPMLKADGVVSEEEKLAVMQILSNPLINQSDKNRVQAAMDSNDSFDDIVTKNLLHEDKQDKVEIKRRLILAITWEIAKADGKIEEEEIALHDRMAKILQVPQEVIDEIRRLITPTLQIKPKNVLCFYPLDDQILNHSVTKS
ncbi:MAG: TerB family tellurite resistance protein [Stigonema ocellatum SAG 48.90 = DSM 106950]|nr:TerB family tellurite resistance protein [Stigonema ocellatum SAG 48.90 = DSM 106950]